MKKIYSAITLALTLIIIILIAGEFSFLSIFIDCEEKYEQERQLMDLNFKAVVFTKVCSHALIDDITNVVILPKSKDQKSWDEEDVIFKIKGPQDIKLRWTEKNELNVQYQYISKEYIYTKLNEFKGIKINYSLH